VSGCGQTGVYTDTYVVPAGSGPCSIGGGTHRQTRPCSMPACAASQQLTPIQRFTMDWGKEKNTGVFMSTKFGSASKCADDCINSPGCTAFVVDWSNAEGSLGDVSGTCSLYSSLTSKVSSKARAVYSKIS
jgi:hypothetical protein